MDTIKTAELDHDFIKEISEEPGAEKIALCFNCTGCTAGCPMSDLEAQYNIRKILRMASLGMKDEVLNNP